MVYKSEHKYALISPSKVKKVVQALKEKKEYPVFIAYLNHMPHRGGKLILSVVKAAAANALAKDRSLDEASLIVKSVIINEGPRMKRMWARSRGRADILHKRMSHIAVEISDGKKE